MFGFFSPTRRLRAAFARQLDQMAQRLNEVVRERDAARMTAKNATEKLAAARDQLTNVFNERAAAEAKLANADSENARLHRELNAALARCEELAGRADAAENVRDRAVTDMNHVQELQKAAERKLADALDRLGKLADVVSRVVNEITHVQQCVNEWADRVKNDAREREFLLTHPPIKESVQAWPVIGRDATLTITPAQSPRQAG